ncbi:flagellar basal body-associated FliL family protein [Pseudalkalibacillus caeni]|uniref:Flagellar protein FliL n=1 Tax=Exobacillus caeni TaxID=2574798 RepID=A0A5R9F2A8_9BACL|nr:flagellar basal body-associated FliL family protein [Pseudalkalibacillus caeni]TLS36620.1 flagellar basal body-associated protein FliL [Pseudalkalibacillus caeni]
MKGLFLKIGLPLLVLSTISFGILYFFDIDVAKILKKNEHSVDAQIERSINTELLTTNLSSDHFAVVQFNIVLDSKKAYEEVEKRNPEVRAAIISSLANKTKEDLRGAKGIKSLQDSVKQKIESFMTEGKIERILVTEFKIQ